MAAILTAIVSATGAAIVSTSLSGSEAAKNAATTIGMLGRIALVLARMLAYHLRPRSPWVVIGTRVVSIVGGIAERRYHRKVDELGYDA